MFLAILAGGGDISVFVCKMCVLLMDGFRGILIIMAQVKCLICSAMMNTYWEKCTVYILYLASTPVSSTSPAMGHWSLGLISSKGTRLSL